MFTSPRRPTNEGSSNLRSLWRTPAMSTRGKKAAIETPRMPTTSVRKGSPNKSKAANQELDDTAFLPNDFPQRRDKENRPQQQQPQSPVSSPGTVSTTDEAILIKARAEWEATRKQELDAEYEEMIQKMQHEGMQTLEEHAKQWDSEQEEKLDLLKQEHQAEITVLNGKISEMQRSSENLTELMLVASDSHEKYRAEIEQVEIRHANEMKEMATRLEATIEEHKSRQQLLEKQQDETLVEHEQEVKMLQQQLERQKEEAQAEITQSNAIYEEELKRVSESLQGEYKGNTDALLEELELLKVQQLQIQQQLTKEKALTQSMKKLHTTQTFEIKAQFDVERRSWRQRDEMLTAKTASMDTEIKNLQQINKKLEADVSEVQDVKLQEYTTKLNSEKEALHQREADLVARHESEMKTLIEKVALLESTAKISSTREEELTSRVSQLEQVSKQQQKKHGDEIDEMLAQLDLVEQENEQRRAALEKTLAQKDSIVGALGNQFADATSKTKELQTALEVSHQELQTLQEQLVGAENRVKELDAEHKLKLQEERVKAQSAKDLVRKETIAKAEDQFNKANEHYMTLKQEYDNSLEKISSLEKNIVSMEKRLESAKNNGDLKSKLDAEKAKNKTMNSSLAAVVAEKERLIKENMDLTGVCDELMTIMENGGNPK